MFKQQAAATPRVLNPIIKTHAVSFLNSFKKFVVDLLICRIISGFIIIIFLEKIGCKMELCPYQL